MIKRLTLKAEKFLKRKSWWPLKADENQTSQTESQTDYTQNEKAKMFLNEKATDSCQNIKSTSIIRPKNITNYLLYNYYINLYLKINKSSLCV